MPKGTCSIDGCDRAALARGWCRAHYGRWERHGDPSVGGRVLSSTLSSEERFWLKVDKNGPTPGHRPELGSCWVRTAKLKAGYSYIADSSGRQVVAHRFAYELLVGPIPEGLELDHLCRNRACVKVTPDDHGPAHLEPVTKRENILRGEGMGARHARQTHCKRGHPFDEANTYWWNGYRACRTCRRERDGGR